MACVAKGRWPSWHPGVGWDHGGLLAESPGQGRDPQAMPEEWLSSLGLKTSGGGGIGQLMQTPGSMMCLSFNTYAHSMFLAHRNAWYLGEG